MERLAVVLEELVQEEKETEDVRDQTETLEEQHQEPHQHEETHEGKKVSSKYVILIIITLKKICRLYNIILIYRNLWKDYALSLRIWLLI